MAAVYQRNTATYRVAKPRTFCASWATDDALAIQTDTTHRDGHRDIGWLHHLDSGRTDRLRLPIRLELTSLADQASTNIDAGVVPRLGF